MKNMLLLFIILLALPAATRGQARDPRRVNFEFGGGMNFGAGKDGGTRVESGMSAYLEGRYNLSRVPLDLVLQADISIFTRLRGDAVTRPRSLKILVAGDYAPRHHRWITPFAGIGLGLALDDDDFDDFTSPRESLCLVPRVGVRLFQCASLMLDYEISRVSHNHLDFKMGFYF